MGMMPLLRFALLVSLSTVASGKLSTAKLLLTDNEGHSKPSLTYNHEIGLVVADLTVPHASSSSTAQISAYLAQVDDRLNQLERVVQHEVTGMAAIAAVVLDSSSGVLANAAKLQHDETGLEKAHEKAEQALDAIDSAQTGITRVHDTAQVNKESIDVLKQRADTLKGRADNLAARADDLLEKTQQNAATITHSETGLAQAHTKADENAVQIHVSAAAIAANKAAITAQETQDTLLDAGVAANKAAHEANAEDIAINAAQITANTNDIHDPIFGVRALSNNQVQITEQVAANTDLLSKAGLFAGTCAHGQLVHPQALRTQENDCGSCNAGYYLDNHVCRPFSCDTEGGSCGGPQYVLAKSNEFAPPNGYEVITDYNHCVNAKDALKVGTSVQVPGTLKQSETNYLPAFVGVHNDADEPSGCWAYGPNPSDIGYVYFNSGGKLDGSRTWRHGIFVRKGECHPCKECPAQHERTDNNQCTSCPDGYYIEGDDCKPWPCAETPSPSATSIGCKECRPQHLRTGPGQCSDCHPGAEFNTDAASCTPYGGTCPHGDMKPQPEREMHNHCARCKTGHYLSGGACLAASCGANSKVQDLHLVTTLMTRQEAKEECNRLGRPLVNIRSQKDIDEVKTIAAGASVWISANDIVRECEESTDKFVNGYDPGCWMNEDGSKFFANWDPQAGHTSGEHCVELMTSGNMNDLPCVDAKRQVVCGRACECDEGFYKAAGAVGHKPKQAGWIGPVGELGNSKTFAGSCAAWQCDADTRATTGNECATCVLFNRREMHNHCATCNAGHTLDVNNLGRCRALTCDNGTIADDATDDNQCKSCNAGYKLLQAGGACVEYSCNAPCLSCVAVPTADNQCASCAAGYTLSDKTCEDKYVKITSGRCSDLAGYSNVPTKSDCEDALDEEGMATNVLGYSSQYILSGNWFFVPTGCAYWYSYWRLWNSHGTGYAATTYVPQFCKKD